MSEGLTAADRDLLEKLFHRAADLPAAEHADFVARECSAHPKLRDELSRLLAGLEGEDVLEQLRLTATTETGSWIGPYELREKIGEGGMGEVYAAEQLAPVVRRVALKLIKRGMDSAAVVTRFEAERQALARMTHPNVAQVYDGGSADDGRPYFVMEFVEGEPITEFCDRHGLSTRARLELFLQVCDGVQHAHQRGLIHRDLKPSNLLVTSCDGVATAKIIDFGVARATSGRLTEHTMQTLVGQVVGTLDYMSPEQADPTGVDIDTRSDIYSLGVVLYELLAGVLPFEEYRTGKPLSEWMQAIREKEPPTVSTRRGSRQGDLDWICVKALEKDADRRYQSAADLADDVRRHLAHEPVLAGRPGPAYRARKFVRRHRVGVAAAVLITAGVVAGVVGIVAGRLDADAAEQRRLTQRPYADAHRLKMLEARADDELWPSRPRTAADVAAWINALDRWTDDARALAATLPDHQNDLAATMTRAAATTDEQARQAALTDLVAGLSRLSDESKGLLGGPHAVSPEHGWSIARRLEFARALQRDFDDGGTHAEAWREARTAIRDSKLYRGFELEPQVGLIPIAENAKGLWEFAHLMTGAPARRVNGQLVWTEDTGLVMVLIPGGEFQMGDGLRGDRKPHRVELSPYFLSKYEMTQGQWKRLTGHNPSRYGPDGAEWKPEWLASGPPSLLHPVEEVSWSDCMANYGRGEFLGRVLPRAGLTLPSEAQWEYAARAGSTTAFWSGSKAEDLDGVANVSDPYAAENGGLEHAPPQPGTQPDGSTMHAPVHAYAANDFGLHNVHGNVFEWCLDGYSWGGYGQHRSKDPVVLGTDDSPRVYRGGSYRAPARGAGVAIRHYYPPQMRGHALGVRPAWVIED